MKKWVCKRCGRIRYDKPIKNEICNKNRCKGRFQHFIECKKCGEWYQGEYGSASCPKCRPKRSGKVDLICAQCGKTFQRFAGNVRGKINFCDIKCMREYEKTKWESRICKQCGAKFKVYRSALNSSNATGNYCSRACYEQSMCKDGTTKRKGDFARVKREHFNGKQFCAICGTTKQIHIHHIIPYRMTHDNSVDNLVPLCASHHKKFENATLPFLNIVKDFDMAKTMLNIMIRTRQQDTFNAIIEA